MKHFLFLVLSFFFSFLAIAKNKPNIILFLVDDMGWQDTSVPFYYDSDGQPIITKNNLQFRTPAMEKLAAKGVKYTNAYAAPICSPTRVSILTGQSAARHRVTNWTLRANTDQSHESTHFTSPKSWNLNGPAPTQDKKSKRVYRTDNTLPRLLQKAGYLTAHIGKAHYGADGLLGEDPKHHGFDINIAGHAAGAPGSYLGQKNYSRANTIWSVPHLEKYHGTDTYLNEALTLEASSIIKQAATQKRPFFLQLAHYAPHAPYEADARFLINYPELKGTELAYATMIESMDKSLGDIMQTLEDSGIAENTLILFISDNGGQSAEYRGISAIGKGANTHNHPLRAGKGSAYEGGTRVPAILAWAKPSSTNKLQQFFSLTPNSISHQPFIVEDIMPTLLAFAGTSSPRRIDGKSFISKDSRERTPHLLFHVPHLWSPNASKQQQGYEMHSALRHGDWKVIYFYEGARWELYHLSTDISESTNLADSKQHQSRLSEMAKLLITDLRKRHAQFPTRRDNGQPAFPQLPRK